jgi:hypothetical protein
LSWNVKNACNERCLFGPRLILNLRGGLFSCNLFVAVAIGQCDATGLTLGNGVFDSSLFLGLAAVAESRVHRAAGRLDFVDLSLLRRDSFSAVSTMIYVSIDTHFS